MDSITQATLGAAVGQLVLGKRIGRRAMFWGALIGTLPDLDILFNPFFDNAGQLWWHRGPSHSLLVMGLAALLLARPLAKLWRAERIGAWHAAGFVLLEWASHVLIDCFNAYGTQVLWPFDARRVAWGNLSIIDPLFTLPMLVALVWLAFLREPAQAARRQRILLVGMGLSGLYVGLSFGAKAIVSHGFEADLARRQAPPLRRIESPTIGNILLWRAVAEHQHELWVGYRSLFDRPGAPIEWTIYPKGHGAVTGTPAARELALLDAFADGWWIARRHAKGAWIGDLRFAELRNTDPDRGVIDHHLVFAWDLLNQAESQRLRPKPRPKLDGSTMLRRIGLRAAGKREGWEGAARLEGITGQLPEPLENAP